ncbi:short chain dehydrogenase [Geopyxis carbonaria]|nr:short chain dehydrogenase [Geopyxis carbonaria]
MAPTTAPKPAALVIGASRGIGRQIALALAAAGYAVTVAGKTTSMPSPGAPAPDPNSPASTINTVVREIIAQGHTATAIAVDVRSPASIAALIAAAVAAYGPLSVLVYNAGAIYWAPVSRTPLARYTLMHEVNAAGLYASVQAALPHMEPAARVVVVAPPVYSRFFRGKTAYAMTKVAMSVLVKGLAMDWDREGSERAITGLWPATAVESAATRRVMGEERRELRTAKVFSDAVLAVLAAERGRVNGVLAVDEDFLRDVAGVTEFGGYAVVEGSVPRRIMPKEFPDLTVEEQDDKGMRVDSSRGDKAKL